MKIKLTNIVALCLLSAFCSCRGGSEKRVEYSASRDSNNSRVSAVAVPSNTVGQSEAFDDLVNSLGKKIEDISTTSATQQKVLEDSIKGYSEDRKQMKAIFEGLADRLDGMDRTMNALEQRLQDLQREVQNRESTKTSSKQ